MTEINGSFLLRRKTLECASPVFQLFFPPPPPALQRDATRERDRGADLRGAAAHTSRLRSMLSVSGNKGRCDGNRERSKQTSGKGGRRGNITRLFSSSLSKFVLEKSVWNPVAFKYPKCACLTPRCTRSVIQ